MERCAQETDAKVLSMLYHNFQAMVGQEPLCSTESLVDAAQPGLNVRVLAVGPEGGWSPRDRAQLEAAGFQGLRLGPRILRSETAGIAAIAALQARFGGLG